MLQKEVFLGRHCLVFFYLFSFFPVHLRIELGFVSYWELVGLNRSFFLSYIFVVWCYQDVAGTDIDVLKTCECLSMITTVDG